MRSQTLHLSPGTARCYVTLGKLLASQSSGFLQWKTALSPLKSLWQTDPKINSSDPCLLVPKACLIPSPECGRDLWLVSSQQKGDGCHFHNCVLWDFNFHLVRGLSPSWPAHFDEASRHTGEANMTKNWGWPLMHNGIEALAQQPPILTPQNTKPCSQVLKWPERWLLPQLNLQMRHSAG